VLAARRVLPGEHRVSDRSVGRVAELLAQFRGFPRVGERMVVIAEHGVTGGHQTE